MAMLMSVMSFAAETVLFTQTYPGNPTKYVNGYTASYSVTTNDFKLTYQNINNGQASGKGYPWTIVRSGSKSAASIATITSEKIAKPVAKVAINFTQVAAASTNALYLEMSSSSTFTSPTKISATIAQGIVEFPIASPAENQYYRITIDQKKASANGFNRFDKVIFYEGEAVEEDPNAVKYTITTAVNDEKMGSVSGYGEYKEGTVAYLTATPNTGYEFVKWNNGSTENPLKVTVTENVTYTATFQAQTPITCSQVAGLSVDAAFTLGEFVVTYTNGAYTYIKDATGSSMIYAYDFGLKAGDIVTGFSGIRAVFNGLIQITPAVTKAQLTITAGTAPQPEVMTADPTKDDMNKYVKFEKVQFSSTAFSSQNINATIVGQTTQFAVRDQWKTNNTFVKGGTYEFIGAVSYYNAVQVNFISATKVSLTISATATGGKVTGTGEYMEGDEATLIATANEGYEFVNWTWADEVVCTTPEYTFEVEEAMSLVANFAKKTYTVTATAENGSVAGLAADGKYEHGAEATLTATAAEGYEFTCWTSGKDTVSTANPYKFTVTADVALVANFKEAAPTYDLELVAKDLYSASDEVKTQFEGSNSLNPDMTISVTLFASKYGTYTSTGAEEDEFNAFYAGSQILGELTYSYSDELKSDLVVIIGTITDEEETSTIKVTMYEEYLEPTDVVVLNNLQKNVQKMGWMSNLMLFNAANDTIITISGCDGTYGKYSAWGTFGADELEGKGEWKNDGENDVFVGVLYNADKTKVFQVTATTPAEKIKEYTYELADVSFTLSEASNTLIIEAYAEEPEPVQVYLELAGWTPEQTIYAVGEMCGSIANMDNIEGADVANLTYEVESYLEGKELTITAQVEDATGNTYLLILTGEYDSTTTALDNLNTTVAPVKMIENGQLIIINNGVQYNAQGQVIK